VLVGGSPIRLLRLTAAGRALVDRLAAGEPVPAVQGAQRLTRRLLDAGLAHPRPPALATRADVVVVIPVRNDHHGLAATLRAVTADSIVVVDDASSTPLCSSITGRAPTTVVRRSAQGGPGAARNDGWRAAGREFVAFVDANCEPEAGWLDVLLPHFGDPLVAAVAPRIVAAPHPAAPRWLVAYEEACSPLDLGPRKATVRPGSPVAYVPTAALVVRRAALEALGGFDETLQVGEDVDFVWRLVAAGWTVRYEPAAKVRHPMRPTPAAALAQRYRYGTSAAALARRHGDAVAPAAVSPWTAAAWSLIAAGHPLTGAAAAGYSVAALAGRVPSTPTMRRPPRPAVPDALHPSRPPAELGATRLPLGEAVRLAGIGHLRGGLSLARAVRRAWAPTAVALAVASRRARPALLATAVVPGLVEWARRRPRLDPVRFSALHLADDLAYGAGLCAGCARERSVRALLPHVRAARRTPLRQTGPPPSPSIGGRA